MTVTQKLAQVAELLKECSHDLEQMSRSIDIATVARAKELIDEAYYQLKIINDMAGNLTRFASTSILDPTVRGWHGAELQTYAKETRWSERKGQ